MKHGDSFLGLPAVIYPRHQQACDLYSGQVQSTASVPLYRPHLICPQQIFFFTHFAPVSLPACLILVSQHLFYFHLVLIVIFPPALQTLSFPLKPLQPSRVFGYSLIPLQLSANAFLCLEHLCTFPHVYMTKAHGHSLIPHPVQSLITSSDLTGNSLSMNSH